MTSLNRDPHQKLEQMQRRQKVLADFGDFTLQSEDLDAVLTEACRLVGEALGTGRAKVLEIEQGGESLLVRAGVGWSPDVVGHTHVPMGENTSESYAINAAEPVISQDISQEDRFGLPDFLKEAGVVALANVPIFLPGKRAYGLLEVDDTEPRDFDEDDIGFLRTYASLLGPVIDRLFKLQELRSSEESLQLIAEEAQDYAIFMMDPEGRITDWRPGAAAVFGWSAEEAKGQSFSILFTPEDRERGEDRNEIVTAQAKGMAPDVRWHLCKDGSRVFIEGTLRALQGPYGRPRGFLKIGQDVTEPRAAEEALRESEARFRQFGDASADVLWICNAETLEFEYVSPVFEQIYGLPVDDALSGNHMLRWLELIVPEDRELALDHIRRVREGEQVLSAFRILRRSDGEVRWIRDTSFPLRDAEGRVQRIGGIGHDATEEVETQDRLQVVVAELQHRTRNLMGVVRSVTDKTVSGSTSLADFKSRIRDRLNALTRVNGLLSRLDGGNRISFDELLRTELMAHGVVDGTERETSQVILSGPAGVLLRSSTVQTFALALHELATNALKYGALSRPEGRLAVTWNLLAGQDGPARLRVDWRESGVPVRPRDGVLLDGSAVPHRRGYGRELIERALPYQLKAETRYELGPDGAHCTITLPVSSTMGAIRPVQEEPDV